MQVALTEWVVLCRNGGFWRQMTHTSARIGSGGSTSSLRTLTHSPRRRSPRRSSLSCLRQSAVPAISACRRSHGSAGVSARCSTWSFEELDHLDALGSTPVHLSSSSCRRHARLSSAMEHCTLCDSAALHCSRRLEGRCTARRGGPHVSSVTLNRCSTLCP